MRILAVALALVMSLAVACGGDDEDDAARTPGADSTPAAGSTAGGGGTAVATSEGSTPDADDVPRPGETEPDDDNGEAEVTGLAGVVNVAARTIEITRLSGADVTRIEVTEQTVIRRGRTGETLNLADIRTSDRIIAFGSVDDDGAFIATEVEVQPVAPSANPSG